MLYKISIVLSIFLCSNLLGQEKTDSKIVLDKSNYLLLIDAENKVDTLMYSGIRADIVDYKITSDTIGIIFLNESYAYFAEFIRSNSTWTKGSRSSLFITFTPRLTYGKQLSNGGTISGYLYHELDKEYLFKIENCDTISFIYNGEKIFYSLSQRQPANITTDD